MLEQLNIFALLFFTMVITAVVVLVLWHILHFILCKKYDAVLFKEPYFRPTELSVYSAWPMSLFRSMGYIAFVGIPGIAVKRRFKGLKPDESNSIILVLVCKLFLFVLTLGAVSMLVVIISGVII